MVIVATGGLPAAPELEEGADLVLTTWDLLCGDAAPRPSILIFDERGGEQALSTARTLAQGGAQVEVVTPDRHVGQDVVGTGYPQILTSLYEAGAVLTPDHHLVAVRRGADGLVAVLRNSYTGAISERLVDQVVAECGTEPNSELYDELLDSSVNRGEAELGTLLSASPETTPGPAPETDGFLLYRVGDAVAGRNIHAAMLDTRRLALTL